MHPRELSVIKQVLGFDYGTNKVGVSTANMVTAVAMPLTTIYYKKQALLWSAIQSLITQWQPQLLVVGLPLYSDQSASEMTQAARRFGRRLQGRFSLPVEWVNEYLSSYAAKQIGKDVDAIAAKLLLDTWLDDDRQDKG